MSRTRTCRFHCAACRRHFTSLRAFDAHLAWDDEEPDREGWGRRQHLDALDLPGVLRLVPGVCRISGNGGAPIPCHVAEHVDADGARARLRAPAQRQEAISPASGSPAPPAAPVAT